VCVCVREREREREQINKDRQSSVCVENKKTSTTTVTFVAVLDPRTCISFLFNRCRYLSIFGILLFINEFGLNLKIRHRTKIRNIATNQ